MTFIKSLAPFALALAVLTLAAALFLFRPDLTAGSTVTGSEYIATSTAANTIYAASIGSQTLKTGFGSLAQVTITGANTGVFNLYNATTSDVNKRTGNKATSTILIASFPASAAAGTYTFDATFTDGLYLDLISGSLPTSTITYR